MTQKATYAAGAVELFAGFVDDFDFGSSDPRSVSKLNQAYASSAVGDFGTPAVHYPDNATPTQRSDADDARAARVSQARTTLMANLQAEYGRLENRLDTNAQHVSAMLDRGPNEADLRTMYGAGALPSYASLIFPDVSFGGVTITELPYDLRDLPPDRLATYLIDHPDTPQNVVDFALQDTAVADEVGQQLADGVDDRGIAPARVWDALRRFDQNDDVAGAFVRSLGAQDMATLLAMSRYTMDGDDIDDDEGQMHSRLVTLGYLMAGASNDGAVTRDFLESFDAQYTDAGMNMHAIAPLMAYGTWNKDTLKLIGDVALHGDITDSGGGLTEEGRSMILKGISYSPIAAAEFFHENFDEINYMTDEDSLYQYDDAREQNIAAFIHSATIDADGEYYRLAWTTRAPSTSPRSTPRT